ncbi:MAG: hypothetical protein HOI62_04465, partial [Gemmatimonadales bacterium]|nr:hypothetical protein [Gemmatimonadales bacterium]
MHQGLGSIALKGSLTLTVSTALLLLGAARSLSAQDVALTGGVIHTAAGDVFEGGTVVVRDGKVTAVGNDVTVPRGVPVVDVSGRTIIPGMLDNHSHIGFDVRDVNERSTTFTPRYRIMDVLSPDFQAYDEVPSSKRNVENKKAILKKPTYGLLDVSTKDTALLVQQ